MKKLIKELCPNFDRLEESEIFDSKNNSIGWHSSAILQDGNPIGGGTAITKSKARRIALAELCERMLFKKIAKSIQKNDFLINKYPSTSGFAFGFENTPTKYRAIAEACERWVWSKWIDEGYYIESTKVDSFKLSALSKYFFNQFDQVLFFYKSFDFKNEMESIPLHIGITLGIKGDGIFPGSRIALQSEDIWQHGLLEASRHLNIYKNKNEIFFDNNIIYQRIEYFGKNKDDALKQVNNAKKRQWPTPKLQLLKKYNFDSDNNFLWRALCYDFIPWSSGKDTRFVY